MKFAKQNGLILAFILLSLHAFAQKRDRGQRVEAKVEVLMEGNYSKKTIEAKAVQAAKVKAIGDAFGYAIVQGINTQTKTTTNNGVMTSSSVSEISNTMVKGEWVADANGYPETRYIIREKGEEQEIWLICEVKGWARPIEVAEVNFETFAYNCQEPQKCNDGNFRNHDSMFLYFNAPVSGYLTVFMLEEGLVYRLLPYADMQAPYESHVPIQGDQAYYLFSPEHREYFPGYALVDEYGLVLYEEGEPLSNFVYVIFSTKAFNKPILQEKDGIKYTELDEFQEWINKNRGLDKNFQVYQFNIQVTE